MGVAESDINFRSRVRVSEWGRIWPWVNLKSLEVSRSSAGMMVGMWLYHNWT